MHDFSQLDEECSSGSEEVMGKSGSSFCWEAFPCDFKCHIKRSLWIPHQCVPKTLTDYSVLYVDNTAVCNPAGRKETDFNWLLMNLNSFVQ